MRYLPTPETMSPHYPLRVRPRRHLYLDAADILRNAITNGEYPPDHLLPGEGELAARYGISRTVLRQAITQLASENLIQIKHGVGNITRAATHDTLTRSGSDAFNELACIGPPTDSTTTADQRTATLLGIFTDHPVHQRDQLATLTTTGRPVHLRTVLPLRTATDMDLDTDTLPERPELLALLEKHFGPLTATDITHITIATPQQAAQLDLCEPATLLETTRVTRAVHGVALLADTQYTAAHGIDLITPVT